MNNQRGRPSNGREQRQRPSKGKTSSTRASKDSGSSRSGEKNGGYRGRSNDGGRSNDRGRPNDRSGNQRGPGVEKPERHFGTRARGSQWGGVARRGAHNASIDNGAPRPEPEPLAPPSGRSEDKWERERERQQPKKVRSKRANNSVPVLELDLKYVQHLPKAERERFVRRVNQAGDHFLEERFGEVEQILKPLVKKYRRVAELHELYGLTLYRLGRWGDALEQLQIFTDSTGDVTQLPVMADCNRALGRLDLVRKLWDELRMAGPEASVITEGRIVMAGALADVGDIAGGIRLLEQGPIKVKKARDHHVRLWYALADLYERAGDHQRARRGFQRIEQVEPDFADVSGRLASLL